MKKKKEQREESIDQPSITIAFVPKHQPHVFHLHQNSSGAITEEMYRVYKSLVTKWNPNRNPSNKVEAEAEAKFQEVNEPFKAINENRVKEKLKSCEPIVSISPGGSSPCKIMEESFFYRPSILLRSLSRKSSTLSTSPSFLPKGASSRDNSPRNESHRGCLDIENPFLQRSMSRLSPRSPIIFSQSTHLRKPPPTEKKLECTLEELCYGCVKQLMTSRDVIINGIIEQQGEMVNITVKPGWKKGTRITFEGKGDERPGYQPADLIFLIDEKPHLLFEREDDDLVYKAEIPVAQALVGCAISVPLLEGERMSLSFDVVLYPGYVKIIKGQGMPTANEIGKRGDLRIKFLINFPMSLSPEQRFDASSILKDCSYHDFL